MLGFEDWEYEIGDGDSTVITMRIDKGIELGEIFYYRKNWTMRA